MKNVIGIFLSPEETMDRIKERKNILIPLIIVCLSVIVSMLLIFEMTVNLIKESTPNAEMFGDNFFETIYLGTLISSPFIILAVSAITAGVYNITVGTSIVGGKRDYKAMFSVVLHATLVTSLSMVLTSLIAVITANPNFGFSLQNIIGVDVKNVKWYSAILTEINPFVLYSYFLTIIGIEKVAEISRKKAFIIFAIFKLLGILFTIGNILISGLFKVA